MNGQTSIPGLAPVSARAIRGHAMGWILTSVMATALVVGGLWTWSTREVAAETLDRTAALSLEVAAGKLERLAAAAHQEAQRAADSAVRAMGRGSGAASERERYLDGLRIDL